MKNKKYLGFVNLWILFSLLLTNPAYSQLFPVDKLHRKDFGLHGKVFVCIEYSGATDTTNINNASITKYCFNELGYLTTDSYVDNTGQPVYTNTYEYKDSILNKTTSISFFGEKKNKKVTTYKYDKFGRLTTSSTGGRIYQKLKYDSKGNKIEKITYSSQVDQEKKSYMYDDLNRLIWEKGESGIEYNNYESTYSYYESGFDKIEKKTEDGIQYVSVFKYDNNGNQLEWCKYQDAISTENLGLKIEMIYNKEGYLSECKVHYIKGNMNVGFFPKDANTIELDKIKYTYDKYGNWIVKENLGSINHTWTRKFSYYW
jgi:YD repeat-containing protein